MLNKKPINAKSKFIENLTHNSYVIQAGRITDVRYTTNLDKLLSIFEQRYFVKEDSVARKEYPYQPDDEDMTLITDLLYEIGADPKEQKQIEDEEEALRIINNVKDPLKRSLEEKEKTIEKQAKSLEEKDKTIEEKDKTIEEKDKTIEEKDKTIEEKDKTIEESKKKLEEQAKKIAEIERLLQDKQIE
jgi:DNA repair exonuclease SbcCD ATPase subunit